MLNDNQLSRLKQPAIQQQAPRIHPLHDYIPASEIMMADPFKAYDIRGLYPEQLDEDLAYHIGNATAQVLALGDVSVKPGFLNLLLARG